MSKLEVLEQVKAVYDEQGVTTEPSAEVLSNTSLLSQSGWPEALGEDAFHGVAGDFVRAVEYQTEADPVALLVQYLALFGNALGRSPQAVVGATRHGTNEFLLLVGDTSRSRKGTSYDFVHRVVTDADPDWTQRIYSGLSTGEGLIHHIRDPKEKQEPIREKKRVVNYQLVQVDPGISDKRLMAVESEFAGAIATMGRKNNNLDAVLRDAWDGKNLHSLSKADPESATEPHVSIIGHITSEELTQRIDSLQLVNGFLNRFLLVCVKKARILPDGGDVSEEVFSTFATRTSACLREGRKRHIIARDPEAGELWREQYSILIEDQPGLVGAITARAEAHVLRLSLLYALLDCEGVVRRPHLEAALALWDYAAQSAAYLFGGRSGNPKSDRLLQLVTDHPGGLTREAIQAAFHNHADIDALAAPHLAAGLVDWATGPPTGGKRSQILRRTR